MSKSSTLRVAGSRTTRRRWAIASVISLRNLAAIETLEPLAEGLEVGGVGEVGKLRIDRAEATQSLAGDRERRLRAGKWDFQ